MRAKTVYENLKSILTPKSEKQILSGLGELSPNKLLWKSSIIGFLPGVKLALERRVDFSELDKALGQVAVNGHKEIVELLLKAGANVHAEDGQALIYAAENGHKDVVELLLRAGADVHARDDCALRWAAGNGHKDVVELLLKAGAIVHAGGNAAIRWASKNGHKDVVKLLRKQKYYKGLLGLFK